MCGKIVATTRVEVFKRHCTFEDYVRTKGHCQNQPSTSTQSRVIQNVGITHLGPTNARASESFVETCAVLKVSKKNFVAWGLNLKSLHLRIKQQTIIDTSTEQARRAQCNLVYKTEHCYESPQGECQNRLQRRSWLTSRAPATGAREKRGAAGHGAPEI